MLPIDICESLIGDTNLSPVLDRTFRLHMEHNVTYEDGGDGDDEEVDFNEYASPGLI